MPLAHAQTIEMTSMECGECGIAFYVPERWRDEKQQTGAGWYCPNGHGRVYADNDVAKAKRELEAEKVRHKNTLAQLNESRAAVGKADKEIKRIKKRAAAGVCPCCNRTFQQLARHMTAKHPTYTE